MRRVISNTSCLIALSNIGRLDLLREVYGFVFVTDEVALEFGELLPEWIQIASVKDKTKIRLIANTLDLGESSTIALALEQNEALMILDDGKARRFAKGMELTFTGTLGVLVKAKQLGLDIDLGAVIADFRRSGFRIPNDIEAVLIEDEN